jgi:hypothetical protein
MLARGLSCWLRRGAGCAAVLTLAANVACAGEASQIAERGGFLLGHAYRCGVAAERLEPSTRLVGDLIAALSIDGEEKAAADQRFADDLLASALANALGDPVPTCALIRRDLARFERHQRPVSVQGEAAMSGEDSSPKPEPQGRSVKPVRSKKPASTRPEGLSPERRAKIALKLAAREQRRRPPSI